MKVTKKIDGSDREPRNLGGSQITSLAKTRSKRPYWLRSGSLMLICSHSKKTSRCFEKTHWSGSLKACPIFFFSKKSQGMFARNRMSSINSMLVPWRVNFHWVFTSSWESSLSPVQVRVLCTAPSSSHCRQVLSNISLAEENGSNGKSWCFVEILVIFSRINSSFLLAFTRTP